MSDANFLTTIGLEVHAQLATKTKIFCACEVRFASPANTQVCPVCLGLPGALPVLNKTAFELGMRGVLALQGSISSRVKFDRKNYFYPDLPKGYQISQFDEPLGRGGFIRIQTQGGLKDVKLNRLHLEEDAGKLLHDQSDKYSFVDLNRAGTPLAEIVSEPDMDSSEEAYEYLTQLKAILKAAGVSDCDMEKGQLRCDANVSIRKSANDPLGTKVEIKNLNSFKAVKAAIEHEIKRQSALLLEGQKISQETRLWDDAKQMTFAMRSKEEAHDYRYFPEPDLVPFAVSLAQIEDAKKSLPELPQAKKDRFMNAYSLSDYDAGLLTQDSLVASFYEDCAKICSDNKAIANWLIGPVFAYLSEKALSMKDIPLKASDIQQLIALVASSRVSFQSAKDKILPELLDGKGTPEELIKSLGLEQVSDDSTLELWAQEAIMANPKVVEDFKSGKDSSVMFLVGQTMKKSKGKANPIKVQEVIRKLLSQV